MTTRLSRARFHKEIKDLQLNAYVFMDLPEVHEVEILTDGACVAIVLHLSLVDKYVLLKTPQGGHLL